MSKKFKTQDYFRYPKLGKRWRRPKGLQSKLRLKKGGSGMLVSIGYRKKASERNRIGGLRYGVVSNAGELGRTEAVIISSGVGSRKAAGISTRANEMGIKVLNMKKARKAERISNEAAKSSAEGKTSKGNDEGESVKMEDNAKNIEGKKSAVEVSEG